METTIIQRLRSRIMMTIALIVVVICIPLVFINSGKFTDFLRASGVSIHPNYNDGYLLAEFTDPEDDLLRNLPEDTIYKSNALDITKFSVKRVEFSPLSGMGIDPRINLCFEFQGEQPNIFESKSGFSLPVIHVYIKTPLDSNYILNSRRISKASFEPDGWNYEVIIDGMHEEPLIYDNKGILVSKGLGFYLHSEYSKDKSELKKIISTKITAAVPINLLGKPEKGLWKYYVAVGLYDLRTPSLFYPAAADSATDIFDCVLPKEKNIKILPDGKIKLYPLIVLNGEKQ